MTVTITKATVEQKPILKNLLGLYLYEFTEWLNLAMNPDGTFIYPYLDNYFSEIIREPYIFWQDSLPIGFALIQKQSSFFPEKQEEKIWAISEFFVLKAYRNQGIGETTFKEILAKHEGTWELRILAANQPAISFWQKVLERHSNAKPYPTRMVAEGEARLAFRFTSHTAPQETTPEIGGRSGPEPTRFGDWENNGRCIDF